MTYIINAVGRGGKNAIHDVATIQFSLKNAKIPYTWKLNLQSSNFSMNGNKSLAFSPAGAQKYAMMQNLKTFWAGNIDGKITRELEDAILLFHKAYGLPQKMKFDQMGTPLRTLSKAQKMTHMGVRAIPGTTCLYVPGPFPGYSSVEQCEKRSPFPKAETASMMVAVKAIQDDLNLGLTFRQNTVTQDGRFVADFWLTDDFFLDPQTGAYLPTGKTPKPAIKAIHGYFTKAAKWEEGSPGTLEFKSKIKVKALNGWCEPGDKEKKTLDVNKIPKCKVAKACTWGMANLISGAKVTGNEAKKEAGLILEATDNVVEKELNGKLKKVAGNFGQNDNSFEKINFVNPTGNKLRGLDSKGSGAFLASRSSSRGSHSHEGADYIATPGQNVKALISGTITKYGYPYKGDYSFRYIEITSLSGYVVREFYVSSLTSNPEGTIVKAGQIIGTYQSLDNKFPGITEHVHVEIRKNGRLINPTSLIP